MKKIILVSLLISILIQNSSNASYIDRQIKDSQNNNKYNTVKYHIKTQENLLALPNTKTSNYEDPNLIQLPNAKPININDFNEKIKRDNVVYETRIQKNINRKTNSINIEPSPVDFYNVYRINERLIRANNLDYINWRVAIRKSLDFNASSFEGNCIIVHTGLYDSLCGDEDALAFVFAHEMAHQILGHSQRQIEAARRHKNINNTVQGVPLVAPISRITTRKLESRDSRLMEFMADSEALKLLITAGYNPQKAMRAITFIEGLPNIQTFWELHPIPAKRIESLQEYAKYANPNWTEIGKANIYSSDVLQCKKSSDRVSIVINKNPNATKFYRPETGEEFLTRVAYMSYKTGDMENAVKYFEKLANRKNDYVSYVYLSYANKYLYEQTNDSKYQKASVEAMKNAKKLNINL